MSQLPPNSTLGNYHIVRHIGGGGMAQIYLAKTRGLAGFEKFLALKVINPDYADEERFIQMLIDEAKITVGLSHVNICQVFDLGQVESIYYIAMEFVDGVDVLELVNGLHGLGEKVPVPAVALIGRQMCSGLHFAHTRKDRSGQPLNIVHRDISPQNIIVSRAGEVKVVDFGIAKAAGISARTQAGVIKGKVHYMAPEQAMGQKADPRTDLFSTGIVLWEMLTSQMLYSGENVRELVEKVRKASIAPPSSIRPEIPQALDFIVMKTLARRAEDRWATAHDLQVELTKFLSAHAPEFGGGQLAALVERVYLRKRGGQAQARVEANVSRDELKDVHSVISSEEVEESTEPQQRAHLLVESEAGERSYTIEEELIIGRAGTLAIPDARVSRRHARIFQRGGRFLVEDLGSSNGTFVNEERIGGAVVLRADDVVRVGSCRMRFFSGPDRAREVPLVLRPQPVPRLRISCGERSVEKELGQEELLTYVVHVGEVRLTGLAGRVLRQEDGFWVEPLPGREPVSIGGAAVAAPVRLAPGDVFEVGAFRFEFRL